ncbi:hypothetical protein HRbin02_01633 [Candidatus Calditenuaceae archaeon HR02]|nr:hypothetical protein HRbin02_01633 [Candidatus Calditenuaceae archaeon HR02]
MVLASAIAGLVGGLGRLGLVAAPIQLSTHHGQLMAIAVLGALLSFERASTIAKPYSLAGPLLFLLHVLQAALPIQWDAQISVAAMGALISTFTVAQLFLKTKSPGLSAILVGFSSLTIASILMMVGASLFRALPLLFTFPLLVITGERIERSTTIQRPWEKRQKTPFTGARPVLTASLLTAAFALAGFFYQPAQYLFGLPLLFLGLWLIARDPVVKIGRRYIGFQRYSAVNMMLAYLWLAATGILNLLSYTLFIPYEVRVHGFYLGFVGHAILAHAPIILPSLLSIATLAYSKALYIPTALLTTSLILRNYGAITLNPSTLIVGGWGNFITFVLLIATILLHLSIKGKGEK